MDNPSESVSKGLDGIIAAKTRLSDVRGEAGELIYAGYDINELAGKVSFEEVIHLLHWNHLPNRKELAELHATLAAERDLPKGVVDILRLVPTDTPPMDIIRTAVSATGCFDPQRDDSSYDDLRRKAMRLIAQIPMITAYFHRIRQGKEVLPPDPKLGEAANFLYMMDGELPSREKVSTMDLCYILHADHGMNASTFSARVTMATMSDMYSAITSAIGTLKGPLHGGANEKIMDILKPISSPDKADKWVRDALARKERIMGFGHRVYKAGDVRAGILKKYARAACERLGETKWEEIADIIEKVMASEKKMFPNLDWPAGRLYYAMGLEVPLYTPIFAMSRARTERRERIWISQT